jgi:hypothetical protein
MSGSLLTRWESLVRSSSHVVRSTELASELRLDESKDLVKEGIDLRFVK